MKLNADAAFDADSLKGAIGAVLRDSKGCLIAAGNSNIEVCGDALKAETLALRYGLELAQTMGCNTLIVNSDNMDVINTMSEGDFCGCGS